MVRMEFVSNSNENLIRQIKAFAEKVELKEVPKRGKHEHREKQSSRSAENDSGKNSTSKYAEIARIPMDDGHVVNYRIDQPEQPHPSFIIAMNILKSWPKGSYQYRYTDDSNKKSRWL